MGKKELGLHSLFPRVVTVGAHVCLAVEVNKRQKKYFSYRDVAKAFTLDASSGPAQLISNSALVKAKKIESKKLKKQSAKLDLAPKSKAEKSMDKKEKTVNYQIRKLLGAWQPGLPATHETDQQVSLFVLKRQLKYEDGDITVPTP